jgi:RNA-binding protein Nova
LVSNNVAGSIIGRSGQTISDLQAQSGTRIKLSQAGDYFPGTQDRVCLVQGQGEHLKRAVNMLLTRLYALQQQQHYHHFAWQRQQQERGLMPHEPMFGVPDPMQAQVIPGFSFVVRILVPIPCCGMIIGKGGINVKQMVDNSGVSSVRLSPKEGGGPDAPPIYPAGQSPAAAAALVSATAERVVTITGPDLNSCLGCLHIILDGMTSHPDISRYANMTTSYTRVMAAAQDAFSGAQTVVTGAPTRRQLDQGVDSFLGGQQQPQQEGFAHTGTVERSPSHGYLDRLQQSPSLMQPADPMAQFVAFGGQSAPFLPQENSIRAPPIQPIQMQQNPVYVMPHGTTSPFPTGRSHDESMGMPPSHSAPDLLALQMQNTLRVSDHVVDANSAASFPGASSFSHQLPQPTHSPPGFAAQVAIADNVIGSILGRGGRTLNELQVLSNTRIRISQRGEYLPGTKNRVVTIRGPTSQSVSTAQYLMSQRMVLPPTASTYMDRPDYDNYGDYPPPTDQPPPC